MVNRVVIAGGGQSALQVGISLRRRGFEGSIAMYSDEPALPYQRPPLSKSYLAAAAADAAALAFRAPEFYEKLGIEVHLSVPVTAIDRAGRRVELGTGETVGYDALVLATGARPQRLGLPGEELEQVHVLRSAADAERLRRRLRPRTRLVVVGGGYLGLEAAAAARQQGAEVTLLEALPRVMSRVTGTRVATFLTDLHRSKGVEIRTESVAVRIDAVAEGGVLVVLADGDEISCDEVLVAVGVVPNVGLAEGCGLPVDNGIVVDEHGQTEDPAIFASGDCTNHPNPVLGQRMRLESVHNAVEQAKAVAATIVGESQPYAQVPWFYSDQYDVKLQTVGLFQGADRVVLRGAPAEGHFAVLYLVGDRVVAVDAINSPREFVLGRKLLAEAPDGAVPLIEWPEADGDAAGAAQMIMPA